MPLSLSKKSSLIAQSEIRDMTIECARIGGINLAQGVCDTGDTEAPSPIQIGSQGLHISCF
jgi:aminotransferase